MGIWTLHEWVMDSSNWLHQAATRRRVVIIVLSLITQNGINANCNQAEEARNKSQAE